MYTYVNIENMFVMLVDSYVHFPCEPKHNLLGERYGAGFER